MGLEPPSDWDATTCTTSENGGHAKAGGTIVLAVPDRVEVVRRRSYFRVNVPSSLKVSVMLWHRCYTDNGGSNEPSSHRENAVDNTKMPPERYWQGKLVDISAGGAQIVVDTAEKPDFRKNQFIGLRFTPMPYETPLMCSAQVRGILPTADDKNICLGLQMVGLEASVEGRDILQRLCNVVEQYHRMNQSGIKQQDMQPAGTNSSG